MLRGAVRTAPFGVVEFVARPDTVPAPSHEKRFLRSAGLISLLTVVSRIFGLVRDQTVALFLGTSHHADAFYIAYRIPNLLRRLTGEGAVSAAFIPVFTSYVREHSREDAVRLVHRSFYGLGTFLAATTLLGIIFSEPLIKFFAFGFTRVPGKIEMTSDMNRIMFPYMLAVGLYALSLGVLNSYRVFGPGALAPALFNLCVIASAFLLSPHVSHPAFALSLGVLLGGVVQFALQVPFLLRQGVTFRPALSFQDPTLVRMGRLLIPVTFGAGIVQINLLIDTQFASFLGEGAAAAFSIADRLMEFVLGAYSVALVTAVLPTLSEQAAEKRLDQLKGTLLFGARMVTFITVPSTLGLILLRQPIIEVLFQHGAFGARSTQLTATALLYLTVGLTAFSLVKLVVAAFYALQNTKAPVQCAALALLVNLGANFVFFRPLGVGGPPLATTVAAFFNLALLWWIFSRRWGGLPGRELLSSLGRSAAATAVMSLVISGLIRMPGFYEGRPLGPRILALACTIGVGAAVYFAVAWMLRAGELKELAQIFRRRR